MIQIANEQNESTQDLCGFRNPFNSNSLHHISIHLGKGIFIDTVRFDATVYFENGETKGEHKIIADDFQSLMKKLEQFTNSFKTEQNG